MIKQKQLKETVIRIKKDESCKNGQYARSTDYYDRSNGRLLSRYAHNTRVYERSRTTSHITVVVKDVVYA